MEDELMKVKTSRDANLALYSEYNKILRNWFVAFGIAIPALFITSKEAKEFLKQSPDIFLIINLFLLGVSFQIFISFLNKFISWSAYHRDDCKIMDNKKCHWIYRKFACLEDEIWIDFTFDVITIICFAWAIIKLLNIG